MKTMDSWWRRPPCLFASTPTAQSADHEAAAAGMTRADATRGT
jgi:hypothetical protein